MNTQRTHDSLIGRIAVLVVLSLSSLVLLMVVAGALEGAPARVSAAPAASAPASAPAAAPAVAPVVAPVVELKSPGANAPSAQVVATIQMSPGIGTFPRAVGVNPASGYAYVVNDTSDDVTVLSGTQVITMLPVGFDPRSIGVNPTSGYIYVGNIHGGFSKGDVTVISGTEVITTLSTGMSPFFIGVNPVSGYAYVVNVNDQNVTVISGTEVITTLNVSLPGMYPGAVGVNPASGYVYVAQSAGSSDNGVVTVLSGTEFITNVTVGVVPHDIGVNPLNGHVYVANHYSHNVTVLSGTEVIASPNASGAPWEVGVNPNTGYVYVSDYNHHVTVLSDTEWVADLLVGDGVQAVGVNPATGYVYVGSSGGYPDYGHIVTVISGTEIVTTLPTGAGPDALDVNPVTGYVYVANWSSNNATVLSGTQVVATVPTAMYPTLIASNPATGYTYVAYYYSHNVTVLSGTQIITDMQDVVPAGLRSQAIGVNPASGYIYIVDYPNAVTVLSGTEVITTLTVDSYPWAIGVNPTSGYIYVSNYVSNTVTVLSATEVITTLPVGSYPQAIEVNPASGYVYVLNPGSNSVTVIQGADVVATVPLSNSPNTISADPVRGYVYVANGKNVTVLSGTQVITTVTVNADFSSIGVDSTHGYLYVAGRDRNLFMYPHIAQNPQDIHYLLCCMSSDWLGLAVDSTSGYGYIPQSWGNEVTVFNANQIINLPAGNSPGPLAINPATQLTYVANRHDRTIVVIQAMPLADFAAGPSSGVLPLTVTFTDTSVGAVTTWLWDFGDGVTSTLASPAHTYTTTGHYTVTLTVSGPGGSDTFTQPNRISVGGQPPEASFTAVPTSGMRPLTVAFTPTISGDADGSWWDFGDGITSTQQNPTHTYTNAGMFTARLTVYGPGGTDAYTQTISVSGIAPQVDFMAVPTSGLRPLTVAFTPTVSGDVKGGWWDFGDGFTSTEQFPTHTYWSMGHFTASLTVFGPGGSATRVQPNLITVSGHAPVATFTAAPTSGLHPLTVAFTPTIGGDVEGGWWDFGDGITSTEQFPTHTYTHTGVYTVSVTLVGFDGPYVFAQPNLITVNGQMPDVTFTAVPTRGVHPLTVVFTPTFTGDMDDVEGGWWDFGDGITSTEEFPTHTYASAGVYTVSLTLIGFDGPHVYEQPNMINVGELAPVAAFMAVPVSGTRPLTVAFTDISTGTVTSWLWIFGDGVTSTRASPTHTYTNAGVYTVSLTVSGPGGSNTRVQPNLIRASGTVPVVDFTAVPTSGVRPLTVTFTPIITGDVTGGRWDFGDGVTSTQQYPTHTYTATGTYTVSLTVFGPGGNTTRVRRDYIVVTDRQYKLFLPMVARPPVR